MIAQFWGPWTDNEGEGEFVHAQTGAHLNQSLALWSPGEPNGDEVENCVEEFEMRGGKWSWNDIKCFQRRWFIYKFKKRPKFKLRGKISSKKCDPVKYFFPS